MNRISNWELHRFNCIELRRFIECCRSGDWFVNFLEMCSEGGMDSRYWRLTLTTCGETMPSRTRPPTWMMSNCERSESRTWTNGSKRCCSRTPSRRAPLQGVTLPAFRSTPQRCRSSAWPPCVRAWSLQATRYTLQISPPSQTGIPRVAFQVPLHSQNCLRVSTLETTLVLLDQPLTLCFPRTLLLFWVAVEKWCSWIWRNFESID